MTRSVLYGNSPAAFVLLMVGGCAGAAPTPALPAPAPEPIGVPVAVAEEEVFIEEPDIAARERWQSPFAVSAAGRVVPIERRAIVVIDADPAIAAGIEAQEEIELSGSQPRGAPAAVERTAATSGSARVPTPPARFHRVERGDTWSGIATRYQVPQRALAEANPEIDPERIQVGQTLVIPRTD